VTKNERPELLEQFTCAATNSIFLGRAEGEMSSSALGAWGTFPLVLTFLLLAPWKLFVILTGWGFECPAGMLWDVIPL